MTVWAALAGLALLSTALAYLLYFRILAVAGATNLLLVTFLIPVTAILLGALILGEQLQLRHFAGMILIGLALAAIDGRSCVFYASRNSGRLFNCAFFRGLLGCRRTGERHPVGCARLA